MTYDVAIVGGGLIGAACADALAGAQLKVCLLEAGPFAREASWAGAGILHPIHPWSYPPPLQALLRLAAAEHVRSAREVSERTGVEIGLERSGLLVMGEAIDRLAAWCGAAIPHRRVPARAEEPRIRIDGPALHLPDASHVRSHRLARAFLEGARARGAHLFHHRPATALAPGRVETARGTIRAERTLLCAGAWAPRLRPALAIEPVRGQILLYRGRGGPMIVFPEGEYVVPRPDGLLLFGSTLERVGYAGHPTEEGCHRLARRAQELLGLDPRDQLAAWAGLRPGTPSRLPYIGQDPERPDLLHASGHYRNGILLAPLTARLIRDLLQDRDPGIAMAPFAPARAS